MTMPPTTEALMLTTRDLCRSAGDMTLKWFRSSGLAVETKGDGSPVTEADRAAEAWLREAVADYAPDSNFIGEEHGSVAGDGPLTWIADPIDGTKGFTCGVPLYSTLLAVNDEHGPAVGVIHIPATGETVWAGRGLGCHTDDGPVTVSPTDEVDGALVCTSAVTRWGLDVFARFADAGVNVRTWGDGYGFLMAATGRSDAMVDLHGGKVWDFAPSLVIMSEAGGRATSPGGDVTAEGPSMVASNGRLHDQLLALVTG